MACPFCSHTAFTASFLPDTRFNQKTFRYVRCTKCALIYLDPFPAADDYAAMYPPTYQNGINPLVVADNVKLPGLRFGYGKHYELINRFAPGRHIVDYGCGQANFVINALAKGYRCEGTEYNPAHIDVLRREIKNASFYQIDEFLRSPAQYDVIRLSNVLEHLDKPGEIIDTLKRKLSPGGILLVEGPIETNFSPAFLVRKLYFKLARGKAASHPPTHIFFANAKNQREFFVRHGLKELYFEVAENEWPFPENLSEARGAGGLFKFLIAKTSKAVHKLFRSWGNTFIYAGRA
jgi:2-polyprenyl-3-methyl-5-hydroxy-6-metoxy-1,4-benzoquinol methylase